MPAFPTSVQHGIGCHRQSDEARKEKKKHADWKLINLSLFLDDMIF